MKTASILNAEIIIHDFMWREILITKRVMKTASILNAEIMEQLQNTGPFFVVYYLSRLVGSPVALSVYRTSKVYRVNYLVTRRLVGSPVALSVYRTSMVYKVYYLVARRLGGSPVALSDEPPSHLN